ncbi:S1C family serine protease [Candidatus Neomarinimicrobiota bacterium]
MISLISFIGILYPQETIPKTTPEVVSQVSKSVVILNTEGRGFTANAQASGVIINDGKTIVTNLHAIAGASKVSAHFEDGRDLGATGYLGVDEDRDLVCIYVPEGIEDDVCPSLVSLEDLKVGQKVIAIGSPQGFANTVSEGIISGIREFETGTRIIQTTAPVSPGSSGGGLFNDRGELIGITSFLHTGGQNLNFAYPVDYILPLLVQTEPRPFTNLKSTVFDDSKANTTVYITRTGEKYHHGSCRYLRKSKIKTTLLNAVERAYLPCSVCKPPTW